MEEGRNSFNIVRNKPTGTEPLGRPRRRCEEKNIKHLKEIGVNTRNWIDSAQNWDYWGALMNVGLSSEFQKLWS
jgi:hypothetical protein